MIKPFVLGSIKGFLLGGWGFQAAYIRYQLGSLKTKTI